MSTKIVWTTTTGKAVEVQVYYMRNEHIINVVGSVDGAIVGYTATAGRRTISGIEIGGTIGKLAVPMTKWTEIMAAVEAIKASEEYTAKSARIDAAEEIDRKYHARAAKLNEED